ncbi:MAG: NADPH:quinone oxidoreductase family protein [Pseudomonadota bacterium]
MKALLCEAYGPPESLKLTELATPEPGPGEVLIKVNAAALNFPDLLFVSGQYQVNIPPPFIPGLEAAGTVEAVGAGVCAVATGQRVMVTATHGMFAEYIVVKEREVAPTPDQLSDAEAASFLITYSTACHGLYDLAELKEGQLVLVLGAAGGVGSAAIELAKARGAQVIAAASSADKLTFAERCGADETIDYSQVSLREELKVLTAGRGVDVVFDPVGGDLALPSLKALAWQGTYLVVGFASGEIPQFPANLTLLKEGSITGVWWGTWASRQPQEQIRNLQLMAGMVAEGKLKPRISASYPLTDYAAAFADISGRRALGKVVFDLTDS